MKGSSAKAFEGLECMKGSSAKAFEGLVCMKGSSATAVINYRGSVIRQRVK